MDDSRDSLLNEITGMRYSELVGVYHAEGSLLGELRYVWGKLRGTAHCALCDITHGRLSEKSAFKSLRERLPVPSEAPS
jgi:hypothetical protein